MGRLPVLSGGEAVKAFVKAGWFVDRQRGSHVISSRTGIQRRFQFPIIRSWPRERFAV